MWHWAILPAAGFLAGLLPDVQSPPTPARVVFDSVQAKLLFESDVFGARAAIGDAVLRLYLFVELELL
jgi:hypothetical protein